MCRVATTDSADPSAAGPDTGAQGPADLVWTIPNLLSALRLLGVPLFLYLVLGPHADGWALVILALAGASDYFDGKLARAWNQTSRLGTLLDPLADRLYIASTLVALAIRGVIPWWLTGALFARDALLLGTVPVLRSRFGTVALPVHFLGKAATFNLLYAFPLLLLGVGHGTPSTVARPIGWAFAIWGSALYWWAAGLYLKQLRQLNQRRRAMRAREVFW
jgi:cardiolipin synthase